MAVRLEELLCRCPRGADHAEPHMGCCKCVECPHCGWVKTIWWKAHNDICNGLVLDSLELAMKNIGELGIDQVAEAEQARFRATVREALEEVLEHHQWLSGPFFYSKREERWGYLLRIIFSKTLNDDAIVAELLKLFPEEKKSDELEVELWQMLAARSELFPSYATP